MPHPQAIPTSTVMDPQAAAPADWEARFAGTGLDFAGGVLGQIEDLAGDRGDVEEWHEAFAEVAQ